MYCTDADTINYMLEAVAREPLVSVDTETTGLEWTDRLFGVSIATPLEVFYVEHPEAIRDLPLSGKELVFHNAKFDMHKLHFANVNITGSVIRDISIFDRILFNDRISIKDYSLENIAKRYGMAKSEEVVRYIRQNGLYGERVSKYTQEREKHPLYTKVPKEIMSLYACLDARLTFDIYKDQLRKADEGDLRVFDNECALLPVTFKMEMDGIYIDEDYTHKALEYEAKCLTEAKAAFGVMTSIPYANKKSVLIPIFEKSGEKLTYTDKGNPQLRDEDLEAMTSPAARAVQKIRHHEKRISTYFTSYLDLVDDNGCIHPNIQQHGTKTGRFSYSGPNLQNIPKEEGEDIPYTVRGCFRPKPGNIFLSMDYAQQEYRLILDYANEQKVIREVMQGKDVHQVMADIAGITRKLAKALNFACLYGSGPKTIAETIDVPVPQARVLRDRFLLQMPNVDRVISQIISKSKRQGYITNWLGRKLRNKLEFAYKAPNHLIQGGCGDIAKVAMVELGKLLHGSEILMRLQVHDQILFEGPRLELCYYFDRIKHIMETTYKPINGMKLTVDATYSEISFAERDMKPWKI